MISKENLFNLHMRYLNAQERVHAKKTLYVEQTKWITQSELLN